MIFSDGFGLQFDMFYAASMVVVPRLQCIWMWWWWWWGLGRWTIGAEVLFGLFNIITAIFVEATLMLGQNGSRVSPDRWLAR